MNPFGPGAGLSCVLLLLGGATAVAQVTVQGGIFNEGTSLVVKARPSQNYAGNFSAGALTIRWDAGYGVSLGAVSSPFGFSKDEGELTSGSYRYQKLGVVLVPPETINWTGNQEYELLRVAVSQTGSGLGTFSLAPNGFAVDWYVELNGVDRTNSITPFYQGNVSGVPLGPPPPPALLSPANGTTGVCVTTTLTWNKADGAATYGLQVSTNSSFTSLIYDSSGITDTARTISGLAFNMTYYWRVNAANISGTSAYSATSTFSTIPACTISGPDVVCASTSNGYTAAGGAGATFTWGVSGTGTLSATIGSSVNVTAGSSGSYTLTVTSTSGSCTATCTKTASITNPTCTINGPSTVCAGTGGNNYTVSGGTSFSWAISGSGTLSGTTGSSVNVIAGTSGSYTLTVTSTSGSCTATCTKTASITNPACTINGPDVVCASTSNGYTAAGGAGGTFTWGVSGNGTLSATTGSSVNVTAGSSGSYTLTVTSTSGSCTATCTKTASITNPACTINGPDPVLAGSTGNNYSAVDGFGAIFAWSITGSGTLSATTGSSVNVIAGGSGTYSLTVTSTVGSCTSTCAKTATVNKRPTVSILTTSPNPSTLGQSVTLRDSVSGSAPDGGKVYFRVNGVVVDSANVDLNGVATVTKSDLAVGSHSIQAFYSGTTYYDASNSNVITQLVDKVLVDVKVFLQGPYTAGSMTTFLNANGYIPKKNPYGLSDSVANIPANVVDWVLLQLRTGVSGGTTIGSRAAFIKNDGSVVDLDGTAPVSFDGVQIGFYRVVVKHRNHLAIMSNDSIPLSRASSTYDFTATESNSYGAGGVVQVGTLPDNWAMWAGDVNSDGVLKYNGVDNDRALIYVRIGGESVSTTVSGYYAEDVNLDGIVKYNGAANDRAIIYVNIGGASVNVTRSTQVPP